MGILELAVLAVGLSMDAFAVSICKGLALKKIRVRHMAVVGAWFGGFQALMPLIGYFLGSMFADSIRAFDHWVAFGLLALIGGNMIREALSGEEACEDCDNALGFKTMLVMAIATSIDALAVGISLAMVSANIWVSVVFIGVVTFLLSGLGVKLGSVFGAKYKSKAELAGGVILILLGLKILLEHLGVLG
ncbi:MAG: manganese efflux pump [Clostridiales bacterium]|nr:manganese efflux pump [Clostridiales bacterium]